MKVGVNGKTLFLTVLIILISCQNKTNHVSNELNGKSIYSIIEKKGEPFYDIEFLIKSDSLLEYQYNLYNKFPDYNNREVNIRELSWMDGRVKTVVWFHKNNNNNWISIDNIIWDTNKLDY